MAFSFRRGDLPEPPPKAFADLGPAPGFTVKRFDNEIDLDAYLKANHVTQGDAYNTRMFMGGVIPGKKEIALLSPGVLRDATREAAINQHEFAHSWGPQHVDGKGWFLNGVAVADMSPDELTAHVEAIRKAAAPTFDWSRAFAQAPGGNVTGGR